MIELDLLRRRLADAATWCALVVDPARPFTSLRSRELEPPAPWFVPRVDEEYAARAFDEAEARFRTARPEDAETLAGVGALEASALFDECREGGVLTVPKWRETSAWCSKTAAPACGLSARRAPSLPLAVEVVAHHRARVFDWRPSCASRP